MNATGLRRMDSPGAMLRRFPWGEDFDQMLGRMFGEPANAWLTKVPQLDLVETDKEVEVRLDAPGFKPEQLDVQLMGEVLTITGKQEEKKEEKGKTFHIVERHAGNFTRNIALPCGVNANAIEAKFTDGVLTVRMPKTVEATGRKIQVKA